MHQRWVAITGFCLLLGGAHHLISQRDGKMPDAERHKPTAMPDRVILTWASDPATTQAVTWRTDGKARKAVGEIAEAEDGPLFVKKKRTVEAVTERFKSDLGEASYHSVEFQGLRPDTQYVYRVGDGYNWSEWNQFRTAAAGRAPLEFVYVGDAQTDIWEMWSRVIRQGFSEAPKTRFIVHAGDLVNRSTRDAEWGEWHQAAGWINRSVASVPTPGNHEYGSVEGKRMLAPHWRPQFTLPTNGIAGLEESNYYLDIQGVRLISLNSNERQAEQTVWLEKVLADNPAAWTIATFHHPVYSTARGRDNKELREAWQPVFDRYGVDLVLTGHDHTYGRTNVATGKGVQTGKAGTVYVVSVSGPKMYRLDKKPILVRTAEDTQLYQVVRINGERLEYEARTARGRLHDAFELRKRRNRPNELIERSLAAAVASGGE